MTGSWGFSIWKIITFRIHRHRAWTMAIFLKWEKNCNEYSRELCSLKILYSWSVLYGRYLINLNITQSSSNFIGEFAKYCNVIGLTCDQLLHFLETWRTRPLPRWPDVFFFSRGAWLEQTGSLLTLALIALLVFCNNNNNIQPTWQKIELIGNFSCLILNSALWSVRAQDLYGMATTKCFGGLLCKISGCISVDIETR